MKILNTIKDSLEFARIVSEKDIYFAEECINSEDFLLYVGKSGIKREDYLIIKYKDRNVGICNFQIDIRTGVKVARPILYIALKKSIYSYVSIIALLYYLFEQEYIDRLEAKVYSDNEQMISILENGFFKYEGCFKFAKVRNGEFISIYFYSMLREEFEFLK